MTYQNFHFHLNSSRHDLKASCWTLFAMYWIFVIFIKNNGSMKLYIKHCSYIDKYCSVELRVTNAEQV